MAYAIERSLKIGPYNSAHKSILANREKSIAYEQIEVIFDKKISQFEWKQQSKIL